MLGLAYGAVGLENRRQRHRDEDIEDERLEREESAHDLSMRQGELGLTKTRQDIDLAKSREERAAAQEARTEDEFQFTKKHRGRREELEQKKAESDIARSDAAAASSRASTELQRYQLQIKKAEEALREVLREGEMARARAQNKEDALLAGVKTMQAVGAAEQAKWGALWSIHKLNPSKAGQAINEMGSNNIDNAHKTRVTKDEATGQEMFEVVDKDGNVIIDPQTREPMRAPAFQMKALYDPKIEDGEVITDGQGNAHLIDRTNGRTIDLGIQKDDGARFYSPATGNIGMEQAADLYKGYLEANEFEAEKLTFQQWLRQSGYRRNDIGAVEPGPDGFLYKKTKDGWVALPDEQQPKLRQQQGEEAAPQDGAADEAPEQATEPAPKETKEMARRRNELTPKAIKLTREWEDVTLGAKFGLTTKKAKLKELYDRATALLEDEALDPRQRENLEEMLSSSRFAPFKK